ncbi:AMP-binding protein [Calidifontibacter terrae]
MANVADAVWKHAADNPDHPALRGSNGTTWTYGQLRDKAAAWAGALNSYGISPGDRVLLIAPSIPEFAAAYYGAHAAGAILITMNTMATGPEITYVLDDAGAELVIATPAAMANARAATPSQELTFWSLDDGGDPPQAADPADPVDRSPDDTAVLLYTSGTTGRAKGVQLTVANLNETARMFSDQLHLDPNERFGTALPLFHVFGQCVCLNTTLYAGGTMSLLSPFDPVAMVEMIRDHQLNVVAGVPTMWNFMLHVGGDFGPADFGSLRLAASGGASLPVEVIRAFEQKFGCSILEGYGLTESTGASTYHAVDIEQRVGTVGVALPDTDIEVRGPDGSTLPTGEIGEVFMRGPMVMAGYWNRPDATAADLVDRWLRTGDLGKLDSDGYLSIVDRAKDLIIRGGYNVYPREVEEVLYEHPDVVEAAVLGIPDDTYGEEVAAVVVPTPGVTLDPEQLRDYLKERLSAYKVPHAFKFVDALPKGPTGKILKRAVVWEK